MAKEISQASWHAIDLDKKMIESEINKAIENTLFDILKSHFLILPFVPFNLTNKTVTQFQEKIVMEGTLLSIGK